MLLARSPEIAVEELAELAFLRCPEHELFSKREVAIIHSLDSDPWTDTPPSPTTPRNLHLILKATRLCNLRCSYCHAWREGPDQVMPIAMLARIIREGMRQPALASLYFIWHGGETTLLSPRYFRKALWLQEKFRVDRRRVFNAIQSNGTRIDDSWARLFAAAGFSVGVSIDLCAETHDARRPMKDGAGSFAAATEGLAALRRHAVPHGVLAVIDPETAARGAGWVLERATSIGVDTIGLLNALPSNGTDEAFSGSYLRWPDYLTFLRSLFELWHRDYRSKIRIRELDSLLGIVRGDASRLCIFAGNCMGQYLTIEPDGAVSACDKYVGATDYIFGHLGAMSLAEILDRSGNLERARGTAEAPLAQMKSSCPNFTYCRGGCPHDAMLNGRFGYAQADCCGLSELIEDMKRAVSEGSMARGDVSWQ